MYCYFYDGQFAVQSANLALQRLYLASLQFHLFMSRMQRSLHLCNFVYQAHILDMRSLQSTDVSAASMEIAMSSPKKSARTNPFDSIQIFFT